MKVGIQGFEGSFHHQAATQFFKQDIDIAPFETFTQVFEALSMGAIERAVVAIENSLYGSINDTYDLLLEHKPQIIGEVYLHIRLDLLAHESANIEGITDVYSQAPALAESKYFLRTNLPAATVHEYVDTALSARFVSKSNDPSKAAIASQKAGQLYGLIPIEEGIEDHKHNYTRFVVLSAHPTTNIDANKTTVIFRTGHKSGDLYRAIGSFATNGINLSKLESRPIVDDNGWQYIFYADFEADVSSDPAKLALEDLKQHTQNITILGSYEQGELPSDL